MAKLRVDINIPAERYVALYAGTAKFIHAQAEGGVSVQFPGSILNQFVTHDGVHGKFELIFDRNNKLQSVEKIA